MAKKRVVAYRRSVSPAKKPQPPYVGRYHNLKEIADEENRDYFGGKLRFTIAWGKPLRARPRDHNTILEGSCCPCDRHIKINRALDRRFVPRWYVALVIFHELCHLKFPIVKINGRWEKHSKEFNIFESTHRYYDRAKKWLKKNHKRYLFF